MASYKKWVRENFTDLIELYKIYTNSINKLNLNTEINTFQNFDKFCQFCFSKSIISLSYYETEKTYDDEIEEIYTNYINCIYSI